MKRYWARDIHDLCVLAGDLKDMPGLVIETCIPDLNAAAANILDQITAANKRIARRNHETSLRNTSTVRG